MSFEENLIAWLKQDRQNTVEMSCYHDEVIYITLYKNNLKGNRQACFSTHKMSLDDALNKAICDLEGK